MKRFTTNAQVAAGIESARPPTITPKMVGGVYSEEQTWSTGFGRLQPLRFHAHAFPPQRTAPFLVQPVVGRFEGGVRKRALTGN